VEVGGVEEGGGELPHGGGGSRQARNGCAVRAGIGISRIGVWGPLRWRIG
jgi:hypothetical protein